MFVTYYAVDWGKVRMDCYLYQANSGRHQQRHCLKLSKIHTLGNLAVNLSLKSERNLNVLLPAFQFSFSDSLNENSDLLDESTASNSSSPQPASAAAAAGGGGSEERPESRSASAQSGEINPLVYSLPPIDVPFMQQRLDQVRPNQVLKMPVLGDKIPCRVSVGNLFPRIIIACLGSGAAGLVYQ